MSTLARALLLVSLMLVTAICVQACACRACRRYVRTYMLEDAELARVTQGTGSATAAGCDVVCDDRWLNRDAGSADGGLRAAEVDVACTLSGRELTCDFGVICSL